MEEGLKMIARAEDPRLLQDTPYQRQGKDDPPLLNIKELGFDNTLNGIGPPLEKMFFVDYSGNTSFNATDEAISNYIKRAQHNIETVLLYLMNGKNNSTHEWKVGR